MHVTEKSLRRNELTGIGVIGFLVLVVLVGATRTELSGAVIASGVVAAQEHSKDIQHLEGGIVRALNVAEGDYVDAGTVVARLDQNLSRAKLAIIESQIVENSSERARLIAERDNSVDLMTVDITAQYAAPGALDRALEGQRNLLKSMRETIKKKKKQLREQITQTLLAISGYEAKLEANEKLLTLAASELSIMEKLKKGGLTLRYRVVSIEKDLAVQQGQRGEFKANIARLKRKISEINLKILEIVEQRRAEIIARLAEVRAKLANLREQRAFELVRMRQAEIVSPIAGYIHNLQVHTVGGVVRPGVTLMTVVPSKFNLVFRVKIRPQDIDQVYLGQPVRLRLKTLNRKSTPEVPGVVTIIGADQSFDSKANTVFFKVDIVGQFDAVKNLDTKEIKLGMPVEAFITTQKQTVMAYLVKPLTDQFARSMRE